MKLPFTVDQWEAAKKAGIANREYLEEEVLDAVVTILEDCVLMDLNGNKSVYQDMLNAINIYFDN